jgi:uncharacterized protein (DUF488 family)
MKRAINTIGYEGAAIQQFVAVLHDANIKVVIDVRQVPLSRKKGFSKNSLCENLRKSGIAYVHIRGLGDPKEGREAARAGDYRLFEKIFSKHMQSEIALEGLELAATLVREKRACLMCFEADYEKCHRTIVAAHLSEMTDLAVMPLAVQAESRTRIAA